MLLRTIAWMAVLGLGFQGLAGCQSTEPAAKAEPTVTTIKVTPVDMDQVSPMEIISTASAEMGGPAGYTLKLINNAADLPAAVKDQQLDVNFALHSVVFLGMGQHATSGFRAEITAIQQVGNEVFVQAKFTRPDGVPVAQVVTAPWAAATIYKRAPGTKVRSDFE